MVAVGIALGLAARASADPPAHDRPPVRLELDGCLDADRDDIERAARVELGEPASATDAAAIAVAVACAAEGFDAGVVVDVRPPGSSRRYRYALDLRAQPLNARARLIALAVAEAVDASRIELTAVPEPPPAPPGAHAPITAPAPARAASDWTIALVADRRSFSTPAGVDLLGVGLAPSRRVSDHLYVAADLLAEADTVLTPSGAVSARSVSSALRIVYRAGGRIHGELGLGGRAGLIHMRGDALPGAGLVGTSFMRIWLGPAASFALGAELTPRIAVAATVELGLVASGATARDLGDPVAAVEGAWSAFGLAAAIAL